MSPRQSHLKSSRPADEKAAEVEGGGPGHTSSITPSAVAHMPVQLLVIFLTLGTGALDAIAILALGDAFASVMTGNLVLAGLAAGTWSSELLVHLAAAIGGYILGGGLGSFAVNKLRKSDEQKIWPPRVTIVLIGQFLLILGLAIWCIAADGHLSGKMQLAVLMLAACAMGIQGAAIRAIGVAVSTTYMTGALTTLVESIVTRRPFSHTEKAAMVGLWSLIAGAAGGGYLANTWFSIAFIFPAVTLGCVISICGITHYRRRG